MRPWRPTPLPIVGGLRILPPDGPVAALLLTLVISACLYIRDKGWWRFLLLMGTILEWVITLFVVAVIEAVRDFRRWRRYQRTIARQRMAAEDRAW